VIALEVTDLLKRYGEATAVDRISFSVAAGSVLALLGPNGAGKTTTVEIAEGFRRADGGTVRVLGLDPADPALRPRVGVMPQAGGAYPALRVGELLSLFASYHAHPLPTPDLLSRLGLEQVARLPFRRLSGGQQQRLSLAMAVVGRPELVFLDEPTAGLDPQARQATWDLIRCLRTDGVTVVLTTHLMDEAAQLADDVVILDRGQVVARGTVPELTHGTGLIRFTAPPGLVLADLEASLPPGSTASETTSGSYVVQGSAGPLLLAAVTGWCAQQGVMPGHLQAHRTLEDVFLELTGRELRA